MEINNELINVLGFPSCNCAVWTAESGKAGIHVRSPSGEVRQLKCHESTRKADLKWERDFVQLPLQTDSTRNLSYPFTDF